MPETQIPPAPQAVPPQPPASAPPPVPLPPPAPEIPCPMCGETIKAGARICRFCKSPLDGGRPAPAAPIARPYSDSPVAVAPRKKSGCLPWAIGIFIFLGLLCGGGIVGALLFWDEIMGETCKQQLTQLHGSAVSYMKSNAKEGEDIKGRGFWKRVAQHAGRNQPTFCPASVIQGREVYYRGPSKPWSQLKDDDIIACDEVGNHKKGIYLLRRDGRVEFAENGSDLAKQAIDQTTD